VSPIPVDRTLFQPPPEPSPEATDEGISPREPAQILLRGVTTPPATPWDQARAAEMEARLQSPLPAEIVVWRLRRLQGWRPGAPGRFVAAYVRRADVGDGLAASEAFEGRDLQFEFIPPGRRQALARRFVLAAAAAGAASLVLAVAVATALQGRGETAARLAGLEQTLDRQQRQQAARAYLASRDQLLASAGMAAQQPSRVLSDLAWMAQNRVEGVNLEAVLWEPGLVAAEVRGDQAPFQATDRALRRADRPIRPGVSLWGVIDTGPAGQAAR
jgi:hypothetical protein